MPSSRTLGWNRGARSPARSCPSAVLLPAGVAVALPRLPERKAERPVASRAIELLPVRTQAKTHRASQAWKDIRPRAARGGSFPSRVHELRWAWGGTVRSVPDRYEAQGNLVPGIEIEYAIHIGVHEPEHDLGGQSRSRRNSQHIRQQGAIVPTKMAIGACLILPGVPPVCSGANDGHGCANHCRFQRRRLSQVSAKMTFSQKP